MTNAELHLWLAKELPATTAEIQGTFNTMHRLMPHAFRDWPHDAEAAPPAQDLGRDLGRRAHHPRVERAHDLLQLGGLHAGADDDLESGLAPEDVEAGVGHGVRHQDAVRGLGARRHLRWPASSGR